MISRGGVERISTSSMFQTYDQSKQSTMPTSPTIKSPARYRWPSNRQMPSKNSLRKVHKELFKPQAKNERNKLSSRAVNTYSQVDDATSDYYMTSFASAKSRSMRKRVMENKWSDWTVEFFSRPSLPWYICRLLNLMIIQLKLNLFI